MDDAERYKDDADLNPAHCEIMLALGKRRARTGTLEDDWHLKVRIEMEDRRYIDNVHHHIPVMTQ